MCSESMHGVAVMLGQPDATASVIEQGSSQAFPAYRADTLNFPANTLA